MDPLTHLLLRARDGDRRALEAFVRRTQPDVWRFLAHLVDRAAADDLTQEAYERAMTGLRRFRGDASARTWLLAIARRVAADEIRRRQRRRPLETLTAAVPERVDTHDEGGATDLHAVVDQLAPERRAAFVLTQVLGLSYLEAAEALEVPIGTIRSRVARAREDLVARLVDEDRDIEDHRAGGAAAG